MFHYLAKVENQLIQADGTFGTCSTAAACYIYDATGRRAQKIIGSTKTNYLFDLSGHVVAEDNGTSWGPGYVYVGGQLIAEYKNSTTFFVHDNNIGTSTILSNLAGGISPGDCNALYPFGEQDNSICSTSNLTTHKFIGKERDPESHLDNFGARYYSSAMGRFVSADPSNLGVDFWLPQTWNRYSYSLNNPLTIVDRNGLWPKYIHEEIIDEAYQDMSPHDRQLLKDASYNMDHGPGQQDPDRSFEHGVRDGTDGEGPMMAQLEGDAFIASEEGAARQIQEDWIASGHTGIAPGALMRFGNALHTITDRLSFPHAGNQPWYGMWHLSAVWHGMQEFIITSAQKRIAVDAAQQAFRQTFGLDPFDLMKITQAMQQQQACVTTSDSASGTSVKTCD